MKNLPSRPTRILEAASKLVVHYGFDKTTMDDIAREAGVSKGALYLVWPAKNDLFDALIKFEMKRLLLDVEQRLAADPEGGQIANLYRHTLLALQANPLVAALYAQDSRILGDFIRRQDVQRYTSRLMLGKEAVAQLQAAGQLRKDIQPEVITYLFSMIALGFVHIGSLIPPSDAPSLADITSGITLMIGQGLAASQGDNQASKQAFEKMIALLLQQYD